VLDTLCQIFEDGGRLVGVSHALFEGDPNFITSIALRFEALTAVFTAIADDDTLEVSIGDLVVEPPEIVVSAERREPWPACLGYSICWAWQLKNQQGYPDGVRLEFSECGGASVAVVEMVVMASAIILFSAARIERV
jgi:hypothetical protein